jgi:hypothetical protein
METKINNRTGIDFSGYNLKVINQPELLVHELTRPGHSHMYKVKFINTNDVMVVTGDYGNWMFCREFHPSADGYVSDGYWHEKLGLYSTQEGKEFDSEATKKLIQDGLDGGLEEYGYEGDSLEQMKEYYEELMDYVECSDWEYEYFAYNNYPSFSDSECVPHIKKTKYWLQVVFDAFDEICIRMKNSSDI